MLISSRPLRVAETMPSEAVKEKPFGFPKAATFSPVFGLVALIVIDYRLMRG